MLPIDNIEEIEEFAAVTEMSHKEAFRGQNAREWKKKLYTKNSSIC